MVWCRRRRRATSFPPPGSERRSHRRRRRRRKRESNERTKAYLAKEGRRREGILRWSVPRCNCMFLAAGIFGTLLFVRLARNDPGKCCCVLHKYKLGTGYVKVFQVQRETCRTGRLDTKALLPLPPSSTFRVRLNYSSSLFPLQDGIKKLSRSSYFFFAAEARPTCAAQSSPVVFMHPSQCSEDENRTSLRRSRNTEFSSLPELSLIGLTCRVVSVGTVQSAVSLLNVRTSHGPKKSERATLRMLCSNCVLLLSYHVHV